MKKVMALAGVAGLALGLATGVAGPAVAGSGSGGGITVTWDDAAMFVPVGCSSYLFDYTNDESVNIASIKVVNAYGDVWGDAIAKGPSGTASMQICESSSKDFTGPLVLRLDVMQRLTYGGGNKVTDLPFALIARTPPAPAAPAAASGRADEALYVEALQSAWRDTTRSKRAATCRGYAARPERVLTQSVAKVLKNPDARAALSRPAWRRVLSQYLAWACSGPGTTPR